MAATFAAEAPASERSRDVSDPTSGPLTLTPGPVRGSLTSRLLVIKTPLKIETEMRGESATDSSSKTRSKIRLEFALISSDIVDDLQARVSVVVELGTLVHAPRRIAHGTARRDGGRCPRYAGASDWVRTERCRRRFMIHVTNNTRPWIVIVEPDADASLLVVVTAYEVSE
jgi:hypothetical protein